MVMMGVVFRRQQGMELPGFFCSVRHNNPKRKGWEAEAVEISQRALSAAGTWAGPNDSGGSAGALPPLLNP